MTRAVVFAYHNVGVRCLAALLARGVDVPLVVTHPDNPRVDKLQAAAEGSARTRRIPAS
jgi:methionyl-tRNA formyltransferase